MLVVGSLQERESWHLLGQGDQTFPPPSSPGVLGGPSLWGGTGSGLQMPGQAGSGVTQTQEQGQRVPSGPFKGTFDLNPGAQ